MSILFRRGFLLGPAEGRVREWTAHWSAQEIAGRTLLHDPLVPVHAGRARGRGVLCLGLICDVFAPELPDQAVVDGLARALARGWADFYAALKRTGGAHALFLEADGLHVVLDATGTVPVCHGYGAIASHPRLIAEGLGLEVSAFARDWFGHRAMNLGGRYMPGLLTPYDGIRMVMPNQRLHAGQLHRFYPDADAEVRDPEEIVDVVAPALRDQLTRLPHRLALSLSGGMDSRLTLAASRPLADRALYFTYFGDRHPVLSNDIAVARQLRDRFGLEHRACRMGDYVTTPEFARELAVNGDGLQGPAHNTYYLHACIGDEFLHVRSNVLETVRGFYLKNALNRPPQFDAAKLARLFRAATAPEFTPAFEDFIDRTDFTPQALRGFHYSDLFYWEHRLGGWHGPMVRGQRAAFETYVIYNCRALLELMMSRPLEARTSAEIVYLLIDRLWPEVLDVPIFSGARFVDAPRAR